MNVFHKCILAAILLVTGLTAAWAAGRLEPGFGTPYPQFSTSTPSATDAGAVSGSAFLQCVWFSMNDSAPQAATITIYDNTAESGTVIATHTFTTAVFMPFPICPQRNVTTGVYVGHSATSDVSVFVSYKQ